MLYMYVHVCVYMYIIKNLIFSKHFSDDFKSAIKLYYKAHPASCESKTIVEDWEITHERMTHG